MSQKETARTFFDSCESGEGWDVCRHCCHTGATFSCQTEPVAKTITLSAYVELMKELMIRVPVKRYVLKSFKMQEVRGYFIAEAEFYGTQAGEIGPIPPTRNSVISEYTYVMEFDGNKICHMTKIWSDVYGLHGVGHGTVAFQNHTNIAPSRLRLC